MSKLSTPAVVLSYLAAVGTLFVEWDLISDAEQYTVYQNGVLYDTFDGDISGFNTFPAPGEYEYKVVASGTGYEDSNPGTATITIEIKLDAPENLQADFSDDPKRVYISWADVPNAESYTVERSDGYSATTNVSNYFDMNPEYGKSYVYYVSASATGYIESDQSSVQIEIPKKLATPSGLQYQNLQENSVELIWNGVPNAVEYRILRISSGQTIPTIFGSFTANYTDTTIETGKTYRYSVLAIAAGYLHSDASEPVTVSIQSALDPPQNLRVMSKTEYYIYFAWDEVENATYYITPHSDTPISFVTNCRVRANPSETVSLVVIAGAEGYYLSQPATITAQNKPRLPTPELSELSQTQNSVTIAWSNAEGYLLGLLYRDGVPIHGTQLFETSYTDTGLTPQSTHTYTLTMLGHGDYYSSLSGSVTVRVGKDYTQIDRQRDYLEMLRHPFTKLCRLRFLNPNGTTAFALDNNPKNPKSKAFIADGTISGNWQNGQRYTASVTLDNVDGEFDFSVNKLWFGQEIAIDEGLLLSNGEEYYRQSGVFIIDNPTDNVQPNGSTVTYNLVDKWANLDGTLGGNLEGTYEVPLGTNIYEPIESLLSEDRGNGRPIDGVTPVFTEYYNGKKQILPDGTEVEVTDSPYTLRVDGDSGTIAQVILGLTGMVNAWVGYDVTGALRVDPSQDDISDVNKPVSWRFSQDETQLLGMSYTVKKEDVFNDYIVVGEQLDDNSQPGGRAQNLDPASDTNISLIGRKTKRESASGYATSQQCKDLAEWRLKRSSILQKAVSISCSQMFHIDLNSLVEIVRTDKPGSPVERHLVQGFSRPLASNGEMTISATSVNDFAEATVTEWPPAS